MGPISSEGSIYTSDLALQFHILFPEMHNAA